MLKEFISKYVLYNHWANKRLIGLLQQLNVDMLYVEMKSSYTSVDLTLQHMMQAQNFWYAVITGDDVSRLDETILLKQVDKVMHVLLNTSQKMIDTYSVYSDDELAVKVMSPVMSQSRYDFIVHCINHNSYHRGQIITMLRLLGVHENIPETEYEAFLWFEYNDKKH